MAVNNEYKMEISGNSNVAFPNQGGNHKLTNVVAIQNNYGADSHRSNVSEGMP